jgi:endonuclease YncB( thermonuclease family)
VADIDLKNAPTWLRLRLIPTLAALAGLIGVGLPLVASGAGKTGGGQNLQVIDGDTLQSGADVIQIYGIDAPELGQICLRDHKPWACGVDAAFALQKLLSLSGSPVICQAWRELRQTHGPNGELIRVCLIGPDQDLAQAMLRNGYVMAIPGSFPYYGQLERQARAAGLGIWGSQFTPPWAWRQGERLEAGGADREDCNVKGRLGKEGERIYVVPTDADYKDAAADVPGGGQRFCSDEAAREAGWQRAGEAATGTVR